MIVSFRLSNASLMIVLALGITTSACGGGYSNPSGGGQSKPLRSVSVYAQSAPSIPVGGKVKLIANGEYGSPGAANTNDVTNTATWTSSDEGVAIVTMGQVTGIGVGSVAITAKLGIYSAATTVVVGLTPNIAVTSDGTGTFSLSQPQRQFFANATYADSSVLDLTDFVKWSANPTGVMKFDDPYGLQPGLATFISTGTATITATLRAGGRRDLDRDGGPVNSGPLLPQVIVPGTWASCANRGTCGDFEIESEFKTDVKMTPVVQNSSEFVSTACRTALANCHRLCRFVSSSF